MDLRDNISKIEKLIYSENKKEGNDASAKNSVEFVPSSGHPAERKEKILDCLNPSFASTSDRSFLDFIEKSTYTEKECFRRKRKRVLFDDEKFLTSENNKEPLISSLVSTSILNETVSILPPDDEIFEVLKIFLLICETNYFYVHPRTIGSDLTAYLKSIKKKDKEYQRENWIFLVILLGMLSIAPGYSYIAWNQDFTSKYADDGNIIQDPGYKYYKASLPFVGALINDKSIESMQALLLIGTYMTTKKYDAFTDMGDYGYLYLYIASEIAIANKLHLIDTFNNKSEDIQEYYKRLWWSVYTLERRNGMILGKQSIIEESDISVGFPEDNVQLRSFLDETSNYLNQRVNIKFTFFLSKISKVLYKSPGKKSDGNNLSIDSGSIKELFAELEKIKSDIPHDANIDNLDPNDHFYRANVHLILFYYLAKIYIGKPFLLFKVDFSGTSEELDVNKKTFVDYLASSCVDAAFSTIQILSVLVKWSKLAIFSSTDLNFCNMSLFVTIAFLRVDRSASTRSFFKSGLRILKILSRGSQSAKVTLLRLQKFESLLSDIKASEERLEFSGSINENTYFEELPDNINLYSAMFSLEGGMYSMQLPGKIQTDSQEKKKSPDYKGIFDDLVIPDNLQEYDTRDWSKYINFNQFDC